MAPKRRKKSLESARIAKEKELTREIRLGALHAECDRKSIGREAIVQTKVPEMERNVEIARRTFDRALDLGDHRIAVLKNALREADHQRRRSSNSHAEVIRRSMEIQRTRSRNAERLFRSHLEETLGVRNRDLRKIASRRDNDETLLRNAVWLTTRRLEDLSSAAKSVALSKIDAFAEDARNERKMTATLLEKRLSDMWDISRVILSVYRKNTEQRRKLYEDIDEKDRADRRTINRQTLRTEALFEEIARIREKILLYERDAVKQLQQLSDQFNVFRTTYRKMNENFVHDRKKDRAGATTMSTLYNDGIVRLEVLTNKAEYILALVQICRKYETQCEKILPPNFDETIRGVSPMKFPQDGLSADPFTKEFYGSLALWRRLGLVRADVCQLRIQRNEMLSRSRHLQVSVKSRISVEHQSKLLPDNRRYATVEYISGRILDREAFVERT